MSNLMDFLGQLEKLAYSLAVWIILIPKTAIKIFMDPSWVRGYVAKEFAESAEAEKAGKSGEKLRFDDYVSPVILLLLCSLVPFVGYQLLPPFGLTYINGEQINESKTCVVNTPCSFNIEGNYFDTDYTAAWQFRDTPSVPVKAEDLKASPELTLNEDQLTYSLASQQDFQWTSPGDKEVYVEIKNSNGTVIGSASRIISVGQTQSDTQASDAVAQTADESQQPGTTRGKLAGELQKNGYLGVLFLVPALIFAMAARGIKGQQISAEALKEVFYAQCYYFTPISLFFYIVLYGAYFLTDDLLGNYAYVLLALIGIGIWFLVTEVNTIAQERDLKSKWPAFWIFARTSLFLVVAGLILGWFIIFPDSLRWLSYQILKFGIIGLVIYSFLWRRMSAWWKNRKSKKDAVPVQV
jgi:hypothetical protein